ncbi:IclR family transcriptional regulator [Paraburkholderia sp. RL17-337-BIB-A]|uniref:IclR family transcriptional regulator n=1 Tax=Paraburkholderia sp. RL17-337-BIB-A TaxID=3031636 RepID=UPI0038B8FF11
MTTSREVPALARASDLLEALASARQPMRASALAERTGLSRSTLYMLLNSLEARQWIEKRQGGFIIGVKLFELGCAYVHHDGLQAAFRREASAFVADHNEVVQLAVLDGAEVIYIAREDAQRPVRLVSDLGSRLPAHCSALGKALLASLPDSELNRVLPKKLIALTAHSSTQRDTLLSELSKVRTRGFASEREEVSLGLACFACYVGMTPLGKRVAVSTSIPLERLTRRRESTIATSLVRLASKIGQALH